jgi:hypothetical protein
VLALLARRRFRRRVFETLAVTVVCIALGWAMTHF